MSDDAVGAGLCARPRRTDMVSDDAVGAGLAPARVERTSMTLESLVLPRLDRVDLVTVKLPFVAPFGTSVHVWTDKEALLMRVRSEGVTAWSECVSDPDPFYAYETNETVRHIVTSFLLPLVEPGISLGELEARFRRVRGHGMAKATVENALLILMAEQRGVPLHVLLGRPACRIMSGLSIGLKDSKAELLAAVEHAVQRGYHRVKMKVKKGQDIDWVGAVREQYPRLPLMVDANGDYSLDDVAHLQQLDAFDLMMVEQPLSYTDIFEHATLQKAMRTPICLDESIHSLADAKAAIALGACRIINIKHGRVGGDSGVDADCRVLGGARHRRLVGRHGRDRYRPGGEHPPPDGRRLLVARRHIGNRRLLHRGHHRHAGRARRRRLHRCSSRSWHRAARTGRSCPGEGDTDGTPSCLIPVGTQTPVAERVPSCLDPARFRS